MALNKYSGAVAVITGGASGIGLATARALYTAGAHVVLADVNEQGLQQAGQLVREGNPSSTGQVLAVVTDVAREEQVQDLMRQALDTCGRIDLVVTCAGLGHGGPIDLFTGQEMQTLMNVNFMGTYHCARAALPAMRKQNNGHFVFISSVAGKICTPMLTGYTATKWAVRGFSSALRAELYETGIGITTVYPAWVDTPMVHQEGDASQVFEIEIMLTPEQVANEILQAVLEDRRDLTLVPNPDIAALLQMMQTNQDMAEQMVGATFKHRLERLQEAQPK